MVALKWLFCPSVCAAAVDGGGTSAYSHSIRIARSHTATWMTMNASACNTTQLNIRIFVDDGESRWITFTWGAFFHSKHAFFSQISPRLHAFSPFHIHYIFITKYHIFCSSLFFSYCEGKKGAEISACVCVCVYERVRIKMGIYINSPSLPIYLRACVCVCVRPLLYLFYTHIFRVVSIPSMLCDFITSAAIHTDPNFILRECWLLRHR